MSKKPHAAMVFSVPHTGTRSLKHATGFDHLHFGSQDWPLGEIMTKTEELDGVLVPMRDPAYVFLSYRRNWDNMYKGPLDSKQGAFKEFSTAWTAFWLWYQWAQPLLEEKGGIVPVDRGFTLKIGWGPHIGERATHEDVKDRLQDKVMPDDMEEYIHFARDNRESFETVAALCGYELWWM